MTEFNIELRVYIEDTDAGGIVYYVNYFKFLERCRTEFLRSLGFQKAAIFDDNAMFVVRSANAKYHRPALLDDILTVSAHVTELKRASLTMAQCVYRHDQLLVSADVEVACVNKDTLKPMAIPKPMRAKMLATIDTSKG